MPKHFTDNEREKIIAQLHKAGFDQFTAKGIRAVRIDDLCQLVGIAKGSFYLFFKSKEDLFMAIAEKRDETYQEKIKQIADDHTGTSREFVGKLFLYLIDGIETDPLMDVMQRPGEFEYLLRKLPQARIVEHQKGEAAFFRNLTPGWVKRGLIADIDGNLINELTLPVVCVATRRDLLPPKDYQSSLEHLQFLFSAKLALQDG